jgi:hypothetical protein
MASTIKLKNGSGAPTTGDLVQGEPALDLTNKRLYTENASGVVIEVGVNPTSITTGNITANGTINLTGATVSNAGSITTADINGGTIDGTVIGGSSAAAVTGTTITGTSFVSSGDMTFGDSDKAIFGAGSDLQIYHDGSNSIIADAGSGNLQIRANDFQLLNAANTQNIIRGYDATGAVSLHYGGAEKLATSSSGVYVTGTATMDGLTVDGAALVRSGNTLTLNRTDNAIGGAMSYVAGTGFIFNDVNGDGTSFNVGAANRLRIDSNGDISFYEDTGTTAKLFWDASEERLGIGTTSPSVHLDVEGTAQVNLLDVTHDGDRAVNFVKTGANTFSIEHDVNQFYFWNQTTSESPLLFQNDGDVIMNGGNVGIGTDSPSDKLTIKAASAHLRLQGTSNTNKNVSINYNESGDYGQINCDESGVNQKDLWMTGLNLKFGRSTGSESMRIDDLGNLLVGRSSVGAAATDDGHVFYGTGQHYIFSNATECVRFYETSGSGQQVGSISITSSATAFNTSSDQRLKENITDASSASDDIDAIQVRQFDWKVDGSHQRYGMVAQELLEVAPEAVTGEPDGEEMMGVDYSKLVPMLIKEVQSLRARVAQLEGAN